jgi:hypothetical protein
MSETNPSPTAPPSDSLRGDLLEMLALRTDLARLEMAQASRKGRTLAIALALGGVLLLLGLGPWIIVVGELLAQWLDVRRKAMLLIVGGVLLLAAMLLLGVAYAAWRRFSFFEDSLAELREDMLWLQEWRGKRGSN